ncbi:MAG: hypothetical protein ACO1O6_14865 [Bacteroidota bacterium]
MKKLVPLFILIWTSSAFSQQKETKSKRKMPSEVHFSSDTIALKIVDTYLDANFKKTDERYYQGKYILTQHQVQGVEIGWFGAGWFGNKIYAAQLDSTAIVEIDFTRFSRIINGNLRFRRLFSLTDNKIENGFITTITTYNRKGTRLKEVMDWSGLSAEKRTPQIYTRYRRNGQVKKIIIDDTAYRLDLK